MKAVQSAFNDVCIRALRRLVYFAQYNREKWLRFNSTYKCEHVQTNSSFRTVTNYTATNQRQKIYIINIPNNRRHLESKSAHPVEL